VGHHVLAYLLRLLDFFLYMRYNSFVKKVAQEIAKQCLGETPPGTTTHGRLVAEVRVSEMYYLRGMNQREIAKVLGCSVSTVSRLLQSAHKHGIVEIRIKNPFATEPQLATQLCAIFGLQHAIVVATRIEDDRSLVEVIARVAARFISNFITPGRKIGIGCGRTMLELVNALEIMKASNCQVQVVPLLGGLGVTAPEHQVNILCDKLARVFGGTSLPLHAPAVVRNVETAKGLLQEPSVQRVANAWNQLDIALFGIGAGIPHSPALATGSYSNNTIVKLVHQRAVGEIAGRFYNLAGEPCVVDDYLMSIPLEVLKHVPVRIAVAGGSNKVESILGALHGRYLSILITDEKTATALMEKEGTKA